MFLVGRAILLAGLVGVVGCHASRPNFMTRVREDCTKGEQWACDLVGALDRPIQSDEIPLRDDPGRAADAIQ